MSHALAFHNNLNNHYHSVIITLQDEPNVARALIGYPRSATQQDGAILPTRDCQLCSRKRNFPWNPLSKIFVCNISANVCSESLGENENNENQDVDEFREQVIIKTNSLVFIWPYGKSFIDQAFLWTLTSSRPIKYKITNK